MSRDLARPAVNFAFEHAAQTIINAKRSENTRKAYRADLARWVQFCYETGADPLRPPLDASTLFRDHLTASLANESARRVLAAISAIYRVLLQTGAVRANPFHPAVLAWPAPGNLTKTQIVADATAEAMIRDAVEDANDVRGARDAAILRLLYDTGLRRASVAQILRAAYSDGSLRTAVKGDKEVELALPTTTTSAVEYWLRVAQPSPFMFYGKSVNKAINVTMLNKIVAQRAKAVGAKHVHPHCFRAAFVTAAYDAGLPEREIQGAVHHSDPKTTRRYDRGARGLTVAAKVAAHRKP